MGYNTMYELSFDRQLTKEEEDKIIKALVEIKDTELTEQEAEELVKYSYYGKWYENERDMEIISKMFPDIQFTLQGSGEDSYDDWVAIYKNGLEELIDGQTQGFRDFVRNKSWEVVKSEITDIFLAEIKSRVQHKGKIEFDVFDGDLPIIYKDNKTHYIISVKILDNKIVFVGEKGGAWNNGEITEFDTLDLEQMSRVIEILKSHL